MPFKAATQHPGSSSPPSLLRWGCCSRMCIASFSNSSLWVLAWSITMASSHLIGLWFSHACSARADFSSAPFWHASRCSFILVSSLLTVSPMYFLPQLQGIWYTTLDLFFITRVSFTLVNMERRDSPDLKTTFSPNFLQTLREMLDTTTYRRLKKDPTATQESKLSRRLKGLEKDGELLGHLYHQLRPSGSQPPRIYGLPKIHKAEVPLRPIVSCIGAPSYQLFKHRFSRIPPRRQDGLASEELQALCGGDSRPES